MTAFQAYYIPQYRTTTLDKAGGLDASETAGIKLASIPADLDITLPGIAALTYSNPIDTSKVEWITYTSIDGTNVLQGVTRGAEGWSAHTHLNGCTIGFVFSKSHINELMKVLSGTTTGAKLDSAKIITALMDTNNNELLKVIATASAVNEFTLANAAANGNPKISATGGDTDIGITLEPKGAGVVAINGPENYGADAGSTDDYAITVTGISAYATGQVFVFKANTVNTGAATLNVNSLGAKTIKKNYNSDLASSDILANQIVKVIYDGTNFQLLSPISNVASSSTDGWTAITDTLTYVSASSFKIAGVDRTAIYTKGTRLKFTQTTVKYAVVVASSFSTDTTVTIAVNTDYTIANAAITSPYYSYQLNPQGYPAWFNFTPTYSSSGGAFTNAPTTNLAKFSVVGQVVFIKVYLTYAATSGGSGETYIQSLPMTLAGTGDGNVSGRKSTTGAFLLGYHTTNILSFQLSAGTTSIANSQNDHINAVCEF